MIVDHRVENSERTYAGWRARWLSSGVWKECAVYLTFLAAILILQAASGTYHSEFGGYPDEPAHYVTSLMLRDYIVQMKPESPMHFASEYYKHYPKVAFGHWPPLFYLVQAPWMLIFSASRFSVLLEMALLAALLAYSVYLAVRSSFGTSAGVLAGLLTVFLPVVQMFTDEIMSETLLVLCCFWGAVYYARYLDSGRWQDSLWFGIFSSMAVLTKGNGWLMGMVPPVALILTRRFRLLLQPSFWLPLGVVGLLCGPWQVFTMEMARRGWTGGDQPNLAYTLNASGMFLRLLVELTGPALGLLAALGFVVTVVIPWFRKSVKAEWAVMAALVFATWVFHSLVPAGIEPRKMFPAVPALILFLFAGGAWLANRLPRAWAEWRPIAVAVVAALFFSLQTFAVQHEEHFGYMDAAQWIEARPEFRDSAVLVSSESDGEGMLISEVAMLAPKPPRIVLRGTKALAQSDWNGGHYESLFKTPAELTEFLKREHVRLVVMDDYLLRSPLPHHALILRAIQQLPAVWQLAAEIPGDRGKVRIYRLHFE